MSPLPLLLLLLSIGIQANVPNFFEGIIGNTPKDILQRHMDIFQIVVINKNKTALKLMMPEDQKNEDLLDLLIAAQRTVKNTVVRDARNVENGAKMAVTGMVDYMMESGAKRLMNVIIEKDLESPSGYKFVSVIEHPNQETKRKFPVCLVGFIWCYMYLIGYFPGTVEQVFNGWST